MSAPPVVIYLPGIQFSPRNSTAWIANLIAVKASKGPGTYVAEDLPGPKPLKEGRRVQRDGGDPLLDIYLADYRDRLTLPEVAGNGVGAAVQRVLFSCWYFLRALVLVIGARKRAKSGVAKWQLLLGFGATSVLVLSLVFTVLAVLVALGVWTVPTPSENAADAVALGFTSFTTWLFVRAKPAIATATTYLQQVLDYAQHERYAAGVAATVDSAVDSLLEADPDRPIYILGYSLGALVAIDFLYPRSSLSQPLDDRHTAAIRGLVTIGCPVDVVRLYVPSFLDDRQPRIPNLRWTNVYIAADILGSNLIDGDDYAETPRTDGDAPTQPVTVGGIRPISHRYTNERLTASNIWGRRGFLSHGGYWGDPEDENCLHLVLREVLQPSSGGPLPASWTSRWPTASGANRTRAE